MEKATEWLQSDDIIKLDNCYENKYQTAEIDAIPFAQASGKFQRKKKWTPAKCRLLLRTYAKYKEEFSSPHIEEMEVWNKIADEVRGKYISLNCDATECANTISDLRNLYEYRKNRFNNQKLSRKMAAFLKNAKSAFGILANTSTPLSKDLPNQMCQFRIPFQYRLLQIYSKYKTKLSAPTVNEQKVWQEIASEFNSTIPVTRDASQCFNMIKQLRHEYEKIKKRDVKCQRDAILTDLGKIAFETTENSVNPFEQSKRFVSLKWTWTATDRFKLLQVYAKYKTELLSPNVEDQKIWEQIANEVSKNSSIYYGASRCRYEIDNLQSQYEMLKKKNFNYAKLPFYFDEAKKVFDESPGKGVNEVSPCSRMKLVAKTLPSHEQTNIEKPTECLQHDVIKVENCNENRCQTAETEEKPSLLQLTWDKSDCLILLQVYAKYKAVASPTVELQEIWEKIAREVRKTTLFYHSAFECRFQVAYLKGQYEKFKERNSKNKEELYFFDEAKQAFETIEYPEAESNTEGNENPVEEEKEERLNGENGIEKDNDTPESEEKTLESPETGVNQENGIEKDDAPESEEKTSGTGVKRKVEESEELLPEVGPKIAKVQKVNKEEQVEQENRTEKDDAIEIGEKLRESEGLAA